jgi:hypothetical protein
MTTMKTAQYDIKANFNEFLGTDPQDYANENAIQLKKLNPKWKEHEAISEYAMLNAWPVDKDKTMMMIISNMVNPMHVVFDNKTGKCDECVAMEVKQAYLMPDMWFIVAQNGKNPYLYVIEVNDWVPTRLLTVKDNPEQYTDSLLAMM